MAPWHHYIQPYCVIGDKNVFISLLFFVCFVFDFPSDTWSSYFSKPPPFFEITTSNNNKRRLKKNNVYVYWAQRSYSSVGRFFIFVLVLIFFWEWSPRPSTGYSQILSLDYISSTGKNFCMHAYTYVIYNTYTLCEIAGFSLFLSSTTTKNIYWEPVAFFLLFWAHQLSSHLILPTTL